VLVNDINLERMQRHPKIAHENRRSSEDLSEMPF